MKLSRQIKPISHLKTHASEILRELGRRQEPMVITQNGEAKAVLMDVKSYEQAQETLALLKMIAMGNRQLAEGKVHSVDEAFRYLGERRQRRA